MFCPRPHMVGLQRSWWHYKDHIPIKHRPDFEFIDECIVAEIKVKNKKIFDILLYRSPNRNPQVLSDFMKNLKKLLESVASENHFAIILTGDFNARSPTFWDDETLETKEGK